MVVVFLPNFVFHDMVIPASALTMKKILIVDPDSDLTRLMVHLIRETKFDGEILTTRSLSETFAVLNHPEGVSIIFWADRVLDGYTTNGTIIEAVKTLPKCVMIGMSQLNNDRQKEQGCTLFLSKPFTIEDLHAVLLEALSTPQ
jgi:DNA-binding NtrC family response regulator